MTVVSLILANPAGQLKPAIAKKIAVKASLGIPFRCVEFDDCR